MKLTHNYGRNLSDIFSEMIITQIFFSQNPSDLLTETNDANIKHIIYMETVIFRLFIRIIIFLTCG